MQDLARIGAPFQDFCSANFHVAFDGREHLPRRGGAMGDPRADELDQAAAQQGKTTHTSNLAAGRVAARDGPATLSQVSPTAHLWVPKESEQCQAACGIARMWATLFWSLQFVWALGAPPSHSSHAARPRRIGVRAVHSVRARALPPRADGPRLLRRRVQAHRRAAAAQRLSLWRDTLADRTRGRVLRVRGGRALHPRPREARRARARLGRY